MSFILTKVRSAYPLNPLAIACVIRSEEKSQALSALFSLLAIAS